MPRKQEPNVVAVLDYFESAPLDAAKLALQLAARAVKKRETPAPTKAATARSTKPAPTAGATDAKAPTTRTTQAPPVVPPTVSGAVPAV